MNLRNSKSFTLMELIVTVVVVLALTVMAVTSYNKTLARAYVDEAILQLTLVHGAQEVYRKKYGQYWPTDGLVHTNTDEINTALQLNLPKKPQETFEIGLQQGGWVCFKYNNNTRNQYYIQVIDAPISNTNPQCIFMTSYSCP